MSGILLEIQKTRAVEAELTGKLALCERTWTNRQGSVVKESATQQMPMLLDLGKLGYQVRGREQKTASFGEVSHCSLMPQLIPHLL